MICDPRFEDARVLLERARTIAISSHVSVDCDNIASCLALSRMLRKMGKDAYVLKSDEIPKPYSFLPGVEDVREGMEGNPDLYIALDAADRERLGSRITAFDQSLHTLQFDHHRTNPGYAEVNVIFPDMSSTCEVLYHFFDYLGTSMDAETATCLFAGMSADTGRFLHANTTAEVFRIAAELIDFGADLETINRELYQSRSMAKTRILQIGLRNMCFYEEGKIAMSSISAADLQEAGATLFDLDEVISVLRDIEGVEISCLMKQSSEDIWKVSIRSKTAADVSAVAASFGGGGHMRAAGCTLHGNAQEVQSRLVASLKEALRFVQSNVIGR